VTTEAISASRSPSVSLASTPFGATERAVLAVALKESVFATGAWLGWSACASPMLFQTRM
jgi:hypothetical protein